MRIALWLIGASALICSTAALAEEAVGFGAPMADGELSGSYGKFLLPNGVDVAMTVQSDTAIDGRLVLRSVFSIDQGSPSFRTFAPPAGSAGPSVTLHSSSSQSTPENTAAMDVAIVVNRNGITSVSPTYAGGGPTGVNVSVNGQGGTPAASGTDGLIEVSSMPGGPPVQTGAGSLSTTIAQNGYRAQLSGDGINISQLAGQAIGSVIANSGSDRTIDSVTTVQLNLQNTQQVALGSAALRVDDLATAVARAMVR